MIHEETTGYLQGMNYMAHYLTSFLSSDIEAVCMFVYLNSNLLTTYYSQANSRNDGFELLGIFYVVERLLEVNAKNIAMHMQKQGISFKHFAASQLLTLFTSVFKQDRPTYLLDNVWDILLEKGWMGFFSVFISIVIAMEQFVIRSSMEDMVVVWDYLMKTDLVYTGKGGVSFDGLKDRIDKKKIELLNGLSGKVVHTITHLKECIEKVRGNQDTIDVITKEFFEIHQRTKDILVSANIDIKNVIKDI